MSEDVTKKILQSVDEKLTLVLTIVQSLTVRVDNIDLRLGRVEQTAHDTLPILQRVVADIGQLREGQIEGRAEILQLREGQRALSIEVRALRRDTDHQFGNLYAKLVDIEIDHRDVHDRVTRLELNQNPPNTQT